MKAKTLWIAWIYMFILCAVLAFMPAATGFVQFLLVLAAILFFVPGFLLLLVSNRKGCKLIFLICVIFLVLATVLIILNYVSALMAPVWGSVFQVLLNILATPLQCGRIWMLGLAGWATLMSASLFRMMKLP